MAVQNDPATHEKPKKPGKRKWTLGLLLLLSILAAVGLWQKNNIEAMVQYNKYSQEELEQQLRSATGLNLIIVPLPHPVLGQTVGLLWEGEPEHEPLLQHAIEQLPRYHRPSCMVNGTIPVTATGKPARAAAIAFLIDKRV